MCITIPLLSFDDNKVLKKMSIGYANICSSVQDHRQKFSVFEIKHRFWKNKWRAMDFTKRKLVLQESIWRKRGSKDHQKHPHQKHFHRKLFHHKLTSSRAKDHQKLKIEDEVYWKLLFHLDINAKLIEAWSNGHFRGIWRHWMLILWRTLEKDNSTIVLPLPPLLCFVSTIV